MRSTRIKFGKLVLCGNYLQFSSLRSRKSFDPEGSTELRVNYNVLFTSCNKNSNFLWLSYAKQMSAMVGETFLKNETFVTHSGQFTQAGARRVKRKCLPKIIVGVRKYNFLFFQLRSKQTRDTGRHRVRIQDVGNWEFTSCFVTRRRFRNPSETDFAGYSSTKQLSSETDVLPRLCLHCS